MLRIIQLIALSGQFFVLAGCDRATRPRSMRYRRNTTAWVPNFKRTALKST